MEEKQQNQAAIEKDNRVPLVNGKLPGKLVNGKLPGKLMESEPLGTPFIIYEDDRPYHLRPEFCKKQ